MRCLNRRREVRHGLVQPVLDRYVQASWEHKYIVQCALYVRVTKPKVLFAGKCRRFSSESEFVFLDETRASEASLYMHCILYAVIHGTLESDEVSSASLRTQCFIIGHDLRTWSKKNKGKDSVCTWLSVLWNYWFVFFRQGAMRCFKI
jgi:hypothetical protein